MKQKEKQTDVHGWLMFVRCDKEIFIEFHSVHKEEAQNFLPHGKPHSPRFPNLPRELLRDCPFDVAVWSCSPLAGRLSTSYSKSAKGLGSYLLVIVSFAESARPIVAPFLAV